MDTLMLRIEVHMGNVGQVGSLSSLTNDACFAKFNNEGDFATQAWIGARGLNIKPMRLKAGPFP